MKVYILNKEDMENMISGISGLDKVNMPRIMNEENDGKVEMFFDRDIIINKRVFLGRLGLIKQEKNAFDFLCHKGYILCIRKVREGLFFLIIFWQNKSHRIPLAFLSSGSIREAIDNVDKAIFFMNLNKLDRIIKSEKQIINNAKVKRTH